MALATTPTTEHLTGHELGHRTASRFGRSATAIAEVSSLGQLGMRLRQEQTMTTPAPVITNLENLAVFGNFPLRTVTPEAFVRNANVLGAVQDAIGYVATWPTSQVNLSVVSSTASLSLLEGFFGIVRVDFQVVLGSLRDRQTFIADIAMDGARELVGNISLRVPLPFNGRCVLPDIASASLLEDEATAGHLSLRLANFGNVTITDVGDPLAVAKSPACQEAMAFIIAETARVSRLQVGLMMAVESANTLSVTFWLNPCIGEPCQDAIEEVEQLGGDALLRDMSLLVNRWLKMDEWQTDPVVHGQIALRVHSPQLFISDSTVKAAVESAIERIAASLGPQAANLSVTNARASLALLGTTGGTSAVQIVFQVSFRQAKDSEVFAWDLALNGGEHLISAISAQVPEPFRGNCSMPVQHQKQDHDPKLGALAVKVLATVLSPQGIARTPELVEAMAMAVADMASVPPSQAGVVAVSGRGTIALRCWVASANRTFRQVAIAPLQAAKQTGLRLALGHFDRLCARPLGWGPAELLNGSLALTVRDPPRFASNTAVQLALRRAIAEAAVVSTLQVEGVQVYAGLWEKHTEVVRINFQVAFNSSLAIEAFTKNVALDGGQRLANNISQQLPIPFTGFCQLPESTQASATVLHTQPGQPYGTILLSLFRPRLAIAHPVLQESVAQTIATVALVPRPEVGILLTAPSAALMRVDFWVTSTNGTLREVAVQRVNAAWSNSLVLRMMRPALLAVPGFWSPTFVACGGTVACCPASGAQYRC